MIIAFAYEVKLSEPCPCHARNMRKQIHLGEELEIHPDAGIGDIVL